MRLAKFDSETVRKYIKTGDSENVEKNVSAK